MKKVKWGIIGTGTIAQKFAQDFQYVEGAELVAVASRSMSQSQKFCNHFAIERSFGSYEDLAKSNEVDIIYIATPHHLHYENTLLCLKNGKAVLCEKPFALNARQASEMIALSKENALFLMDALWTKFLPHYKKMIEMVRSGLLGDVKVVFANFGFKAEKDSTSRLFNPQFGGGSLMDIGVYNVFTAIDVLGKPDEINVFTVNTEQGVDIQCAINFRYDNGSTANLFSTFSANIATEIEVCGTLGRIKLTTPFYEPSSTLEWYTDNEKKIVDVQSNTGFGYHLEIQHATDCMNKSFLESPIVPHSYSLLLMKTLDKIRSMAGIVFPDE